MVDMLSSYISLSPFVPCFPALGANIRNLEKFKDVKTTDLKLCKAILEMENNSLYL